VFFLRGEIFLYKNAFLEKRQLVSSWEDAVTAAARGWYKIRGIKEMPTPMVTELHEDSFSEAFKCCVVGSRNWWGLCGMLWW